MDTNTNLYKLYLFNFLSFVSLLLLYKLVVQVKNAVVHYYTQYYKLKLYASKYEQMQKMFNSVSFILFLSTSCTSMGMLFVNSLLNKNTNLNNLTEFLNKVQDWTEDVVDEYTKFKQDPVTWENVNKNKYNPFVTKTTPNYVSQSKSLYTPKCIPHSKPLFTPNMEKDHGTEPKPYNNAFLFNPFNNTNTTTKTDPNTENIIKKLTTLKNTILENKNNSVKNTIHDLLKPLNTNDDTDTDSCNTDDGLEKEE